MNRDAKVNGLLTVRELAEELRVHPQTIRRAVRSGRLPAPIRVLGTSLRFRRKDIDKILAGRRQTA